jgi:hypothetical protein
MNHRGWGLCAFVLPLLLLPLVQCGSSSTETPPPGGGDGGSPDGATDAPSGPVTSLWIAPASLDMLAQDHFYDHPWPSDMRVDITGAPHWGGFYNPRLTPLIDSYVAATHDLTVGFSPSAFGYYRFTGDIDPSTLPATPQATLDPSSSVQLIDIDGTSPEHGQRKLAMVYWQQPDGVYWLHDTLVIGPAPGYPLRPNTHYAVVVTSKVKAMGGAPVLPSADLKATLGLAPATGPTQTAHDLFAPAVTGLMAAGIQPADIVHFTAFTTNDPTAQLFSIVDDVHAHVPAPTADAAMWQQKEQTTDYDVYQGVYGPVPLYQSGTPPFTSSGGSFVFDPSSGRPMLQSTFNARFTLVVPNAQKCPMPATGYPIVLYAHGTGGDYRSIVDEGNSFGQLFAMAPNCLASMGIDQVCHGTHPGAPSLTDPNLEGDEEICFYNFDNPLAGRTNGQQGAIDVVQQARLFTNSSLTVPSATSRTGAAITFDATRLMFAGHSQGGQNGSLFLAADKAARGGILSGSGSFIVVALLEKTSPTPSVSGLVQTVLDIKPAESMGELNLFHPALNLAQSMIDVADPLNYVGYMTVHPRSGATAKSIYQSEGVNPDGTGDTYAPPHGIELGSVASGFPRMLPAQHTIAEAAYSGLGDIAIPAGGLQGNMANGNATCVLAQFPPPMGHDGHFVLFDVPQAHVQAGEFMKSLAADPKGRVTPLGM